MSSPTWPSRANAPSTKRARASPHPHRLEQGALCVDVPPEQAVLIGWPLEASENSVALLARRRYQLSFRAAASGSLPVQMSTSVGQRHRPYLRAGIADVPVEEKAAYYAVEVVPLASVPEGGLSFVMTVEGSAGKSHVCVDDVVLVEQREAASTDARR